MSRIGKVLIANRGEIACRIIETTKKLGIKSVSVYSDADRSSRHVELSDEAYHIGPSPPKQSYLNQDKIIEVAKRCQAQAIHPGYGFLSENAEFADRCRRSDVIFIGPPASAIRDMGIKSTSKIIMSNAGVPVIEGYHGEDQSIETLKSKANIIGYPVMIKAVRGGGGKGMRIVTSESNFETELESAKREALASFGDQVMLLEKYVEEPRHVEVQIFGDAHDNYVYLFERDCSVQRRHQKIIEEAPAPGILPDVRKKLGEAAVRAARAVNYIGAGTVEFIMDKNGRDFFFMEMNTRLQVEHPVTEMITGVDLVEWQLLVANGEKLPLCQNDIRLSGWSFEARIYAEDPIQDFMPSAGTLLHISSPTPSRTVRIETGVRQGDQVSIHYDPMIAKLVVWSSDRKKALDKLHSSLSEFNIDGLPTNVDFLLRLARHEEFIAGNVDTNFIQRNHGDLFPSYQENSRSNPENICLSALALVLYDVSKNQFDAPLKHSCPFHSETDNRINFVCAKKLQFMIEETEIKATVELIGRNGYQIIQDGDIFLVYPKFKFIQANCADLECEIDGKLYRRRVIYRQDSSGIIRIFGENGSFNIKRNVPKFMTNTLLSNDTQNSYTAPMPGVVSKVIVTEGDTVKSGDPLIVMLAMKMEYIIKAKSAGSVKKVWHNVGEFVTKHTLLVELSEI